MVTTPSRLLVFSDLDGTLLDHETYSWAAASDAIAALRERKTPLILVSSKTLPEILEIRRDLDNRDPFVFENGAGAAIPNHYFQQSSHLIDKDDFTVNTLGSGRDEILSTLLRLRTEGNQFEGFADWSTDEVAAATGLGFEAAKRAQDRRATEPIVWKDSAEKWGPFVAELERSGLRAVRGGRFWSIMGQFDKAEAVRWLVGEFERDAHETSADETDEFTTVALGDSLNDAQMLAYADIAVIVKSANSDRIECQGHPHVIRTENAGPAGWQEAMEIVLQEHA